MSWRSAQTTYSSSRPSRSASGAVRKECVSRADEAVQRGDLAPALRFAMVVAVVGGAGGRDEPQPRPAARARVLADPADGRLGRDDEVHPLRDVRRLRVERVEHRGAHRARLLHLRSVHEAVDDERVLARLEELGEAYLGRRLGRAEIARSLLQGVVLGELSAERQSATAGGDLLDTPAKFLLRLQQLRAPGAGFIALLGEAPRLPSG